VAFTVTLPKWGLSMEEASIVEWMVGPGEDIAEGDVLASVESEKAVMDLPSPVGGVVIDPFAGGATTVVVARRLRRSAGGFEIHEQFVEEGLRRIAANIADDSPGRLTRTV